MQLGRIIDTTLRVSIRFTNMRIGVQAAAYEEHKCIYDAILAHQPDAAARASADLMERALALIDSALEEGQDN